MSDDYGIKPEWRAEWRLANTDLALHLCAKLLESEFRREHPITVRDSWRWCNACAYTACDNSEDQKMKRFDGDSRHSYDWPKWLEAAKEMLKSESL